jgi:hypothetical protein
MTSPPLTFEAYHDDSCVRQRSSFRGCWAEASASEYCMRTRVCTLKVATSASGS